MDIEALQKKLSDLILEDPSKGEFLEQVMTDLSDVSKLSETFDLAYQSTNLTTQRRFMEPHTVDLTISTKYTLQARLLKDVLKEKADAVIERNTRPNCIVCLAPIPEDDLVPSIHGSYHTHCVDGR